MSTSTSTKLSATRLYIGNLASSVDEYTLIQVFSKYGKISKLDYLFHKTGPAKGKPRGYAFVEFSTKEEALRAMVALHDKLIRGRNIIVTAASEQDPDSIPSANGGKSRRIDTGKPTAISLLKGQGVAGASTNKKIAALEAKLEALRKSKPSGSKATTPEPTASTSGTPVASESEAEQWLETLSGPEGPISKPEDPEKEKADDAPPPKRRKIDPIAAGLPMRPSFDAKTPPRDG